MCTINTEGFWFTLEEAKTLQATAFLKAQLFHEFNLQGAEDQDGEIKFGINLTVLVECLKMFGSREAHLPPANLVIQYTGEECLLLK